MHTSLKVVVFAIVIASCAWPQASTGTVSGTVRDQSGAVVPNTQVVMANTATNVSSTTRTNETGFYIFPGVIAGPYLLTVEVPGMKKYEGSFTVQVAQGVVLDPTLRLAQSSDTVQVTDVTSMVTADNGMLRNGLEHARIEQLPGGRSLLSRVQMLPGSEGSNGSRSFGLPAQSQEYIQDGSAGTDRRYNMSFYSKYPGLDAIQEFTVETNAVSAKHSRPSNVIVSTKSGTNQFHGSAWEINKCSGYGVARQRTDFYTKPPHSVSNWFGVNGGGPLVIPKLYNGKDRTFWFVNWENPRGRSGSSAGYNVPTVAMRNGDFSGLVDSQGRLQTLYDPLTTGTAPTYQRTPFINNQIPITRQSPVAQYLFSITPLPANNVNPLIDVNYWGLSTNANNTFMGVLRVDHRFSDRDQAYVRLNRIAEPHTQYNNSGCPCGPMALNKVAGWKYVLDAEQSAAASWVHIFSPTLFNQLLASARYRRGGGSSGTSTTLDVNWFDKLGMANPLGANDWPQFRDMGLGNYILTSSGTDIGNETYYILDDNVTKVHGKHELLFGGHYRKDFINTLPNNAGQSSFTFNTLATALYSPTASTPTNPAATPQTGSNLANMFLGVSADQVSLIRKWYYLRSGEAALYFQDNFRVTSRLTLNLGMRWESWAAMREKNNTMIGFDPANHAMALGTDLATLYKLGLTLPSAVASYQALGLNFESYRDAGLPQSFTKPRNKNFSPRLGFAYRAFGGSKPLVVRGGYSLSYFTMDYSWIGGLSNDPPFSATFSYNPNDAAQSPNGFPNYGLISKPTYVDGVNSTNTINLSQAKAITRGAASVSYFNPDLPTSRVHSWNLTFEKELIASTAARVAYVGNHSSYLPEWYSYNNPTPTYIWYATTGQPLPTGAYANVALRPYDQQVLGTVQELRNTGYSNNQSIDFELERRYSKGYAYQLSYVIMNALGTGSGVTTVQTVNQYMPGAVPTDYAQLDRFLNYGRDTSMPKHRVRWNFLVDLPFGRGKVLGRNAGRVLDKFIGGWQLAGIGSLWSNYFSLPTSNWNLTGEPIQTYGYQYPIQDCRGGSCIPGYLWWNGYIPANQINSVDANGKPNGYMGVPANYKPAVTPLIPWGTTTLPANAPANTKISQYWDTNNVWIPLKNGTTQMVGYNNGLHPWRNQYLPGVRQWSQDASLFKVIPISESINIRFTADFFNVFNHPGNPNTIGGDGFLNTRASGQSARTLQLGLRLNW